MATASNAIIPTLNNIDFELVDGLSTNLHKRSGKTSRTAEGSGSRHVSMDKHQANLAKLQARTALLAEQKAKSVDELVLQDMHPAWDDDNRGAPNSLIRGGLFSVRDTKEREFINIKIPTLSNYEVHYEGRELDQIDLSVWLALINMARARPMSDCVYFSGYQLIRDLGFRMHSDSYRRVQESISRLKVTGVKIISKDVGKGYSGALIRDFAWDGEDDSGKTKWMVRFESRISVLFLDDSTTLLDWECRKKLGTRNHIALWLHSFYSTHREPYPMSVVKIHELCRSSDKLASFRRNLNNALTRLKDVGFLKDYQITKEDLVQVEKMSSVRKLQQIK